MKIEAILFDLDNTLVSTNNLKDIRDRGAYDEITPELLATVKPYKNIKNLLSLLISKGIKIGVVTNSSKTYADKIIPQLHLPDFDVIVTYTDVGRAGMKPNPTGINLALSRLGISHPERVIYIGDDYTDIIASYYAGVIPIVPSWASRIPVSQVPAAVLSSEFLIDECDTYENIILMAEKCALHESFSFQRKRFYFVPLDESANVIPASDTLSTICLGRYFSQKSILTTKLHDSHPLSKEIAKKEHKENYTPPDYWGDILAHAADKIPEFFKAKKYFDIITIIPSKKEKAQRLEHVLANARSKSQSNSQFLDDLFVFDEGARSLKTLPRDQRGIEIETTLHINPKYDGKLIGKSILIFDDVITTGSTLKRAYALLRNQVVKHSLGICLAKTVSISEEDRLCPKCQSHVLRIRRNHQSGIRFWGCSGYNDNREQCDYSEGIVEKQCPQCGRDMLKKYNKQKGICFLSCTGWNQEPKCNYTENE
ncbi:HAD family hydrolase [Pectobacterium parmentieri]|uniref:HAD-IA family hydrolase n=1 Tax=Pectobacterium TaxID=122277 RepID=UPI00101C903A|nr:MULTISPECIES: HAD-IA family hydrolase [Pectobacterium]MCL6354365.1 HAD family hydrolase [Pectobacterium parmentieri]MCL6398381.1 HAD family hydrolase [Pectobacterium carotovorum subsp. carotovorum]RYC48139.1 hypothetical protein DEH81_07270 [Pectobacterium zantedeschiae]